MKGIILAAGEGKRLQPYTFDRPKCLVCYQGYPIIDYILSSFAATGITDVSVVTGYRSELVRRPGLTEYHNPEYKTTNMVRSLFCAREKMIDDVVISYGDIVYRLDVLEKLVLSENDFSVVVDSDWRSLWEARMDNPLEDAETLKIDAQGFIKEIGKRASAYSDIEAQYIGLIRIKGDALTQFLTFYDKMVESSPESVQDMYMTDFIQLMIDNHTLVKALQIEGGWTEIDRPSDLDHIVNELHMQGERYEN